LSRKKRKKKKKNNKKKILGLIIIVAIVVILGNNRGLVGDLANEVFDYYTSISRTSVSVVDDNIIDSIPEYSGDPYIYLNDNKPPFTEEDITTDAFEYYSELDGLGRCSAAYANICKELMPTEERGEIGSIKPSGWQTIRYDDLIDGNYLYNRCHLIGFQLAGENANKLNLITGTRHLNIDGMLSFENEVAEYVVEEGNHVLYRVTPIFEGNNLVCSGLTIEAYSVEDNGDGVEFYVYCYNVQPGISIDYLTGDSQETR